MRFQRLLGSNRLKWISNVRGEAFQFDRGLLISAVICVPARLIEFGLGAATRCGSGGLRHRQRVSDFCLTEEQAAAQCAPAADSLNAVTGEEFQRGAELAMTPLGAATARMGPLENENGMHRIICPNEIPVNTAGRPVASYLIPVFNSPSILTAYKNP